MLLFILFLPVVIGFCLVQVRNQYEKYFSFSCVLYVIFIVAFRADDYGLDMVNYYHIFMDKSYYILDEPGLNFLNAIIKTFSDEYIVFSLVYAFILNVLLISLYKKIDSKFYFLAFAFLFTSFTFYQINYNIYRQGLSVILMLFSLLHFQNKSHIKFFVFFTASILIHKASILGVGFIIMLMVNLRFKPIYGYAAVIMSVIAVSDSLWFFISKNLMSILPVFSNSLTEYMRLTGTDIIPPSSLNHRNIPIILIVLIYSISWRRLKRTENEINEVEHLLLMISVGSLLLASIFSSNILLYDRVILFAQILMPSLFVSTVNRYIKNDIRLIVLLLSIAQLMFTLLFWGPRNFIPEYIFYGL